uniref:Uncharacterized protein n=2 Tax=unclassified Caudoviricetes TaxID=2788787 RepID=A0A8S5TDV9_9CAUD|nr:MAG TPA: hypothetical protein [Podoviridae sp. ctIi96]DAF61484.1 MAG TPA: hypothetical protein [Podoviridae sp. ctzXp5]DAS37309.1 MAG TPA: hypothetical protein [Caudoviricetes sp.]
MITSCVLHEKSRPTRRSDSPCRAFDFNILCPVAVGQGKYRDTGTTGNDKSYPTLTTPHVIYALIHTLAEK